MSELDDELTQADRRGDAGKGHQLAAEREAPLAQVASATGLEAVHAWSGRRASGRGVAVQKAISAAVARISDVDPALGRLLADRVSTGMSCLYVAAPGRSVRWVLGPPGPGDLGS